jgi:hypothetical protein
VPKAGVLVQRRHRLSVDHLDPDALGRWRWPQILLGAHELEVRSSQDLPVCLDTGGDPCSGSGR